MTLFKMIKAFFTIPQGLYCYRINRVEWGGKKLVPFLHTDTCGFYSDCDGEDNFCEHCSFLNMELHDQIKDCGIRDNLSDKLRDKLRY